MTKTATDQLRVDVLDWASNVRDLLQKRGDEVAVKESDAATCQFGDSRFVVTVLGKAKRGKSTLLNALLGRRDDVVAPIDKLPASCAITRIAAGTANTATVNFRDGHNESIDFSRIREFVTEETNPQNIKQVNVVDVRGHFPSLAPDLELVDTPGAGSIHEYHDTLLYAFIPQSDAVIFVVTARMPLDQDELELLKRVKAADIKKVFFVINRVDEMPERDIAAAEHHNRKLLAEIGVSVDKLHRLSAKQAFQGDVSGSGVPELMADVSSFLAKNKGRYLLDRCVTRVCQAATPALQGMQVELDSNCKTTEELQADLAKLQTTRSSLEQQQRFATQEFTAAWIRALDEFEFGLSPLQTEVTNDLIGKIGRSSLSDVSKVAKDLPTLLNQSLDDRLSPSSRRLEESIRAACRKLETDYPSINFVPSGDLMIRTRTGNTMLVGTLGGAAGTATGVSVVAAGAAAAQAIAVANATALAATSTIAAPSLVSSILGLAGLDVLVPLATGTATVATPAAITTTPLWVALAGPIGWSLAGLSVLAIPLAWRAPSSRFVTSWERPYAIRSGRFSPNSGVNKSSRCGRCPAPSQTNSMSA